MTAADHRRRRRPALVALVVYTLRACLPGQAVGRRRSSLRRRRCCSGSSPAPSTTRRPGPSPSVAAGALFGLVMPVTCLVIGDAVLGAEVRSGTFALHLDVARCRPGRSPSAAGSAARSRRPGRLAIAFALAAVVAGVPESAGADRARGRLRRPGLHGGVPRHRLHHQAGGGVVARLRLPRRAAPRRRADRHRAALPVMGGPGRVRRPQRRPQRPRPRGHAPRHRRPRPPLPHLRRRPRPHHHQAALPEAHRLG